jgi:multimeric flavodoxin WrbA
VVRRQYPLYNKVAGVVVTGNEDGAHAAAETTLFNMTHLGCAVPPNADTYGVGDAGPGPSYIEAGGEQHEYTKRTTRWMAHNVVHLARILKANPIPAEGNTFEDETDHPPTRELKHRHDLVSDSGPHDVRSSRYHAS